jgi:starch synthase (maltosyl-transferring)
VRQGHLNRRTVVRGNPNSCPDRRNTVVRRRGQRPRLAEFREAVGHTGRAWTTTPDPEATNTMAPLPELPDDRTARGRVVLEDLRPGVDHGRFAITRTPGEPIAVEIDAFAEGHDVLAVELRVRHTDDPDWTSRPMCELGNDRWAATFVADRIGVWEYTVSAWIDEFGTWLRGLERNAEAGNDVTVDILIGAGIARSAASRARGAQATSLRAWARELEDTASPIAGRVTRAGDERIGRLCRKFADRTHATDWPVPYRCRVDRERARFSSWYELFPRSASGSDRHGTFADVAARLDDIAAMGFDVLYLPPIHPIGTTARKGRNNTTDAAPGDVGSPWAIGGAEGGHGAIHPALGTVADFTALVDAASARGIEIALDLALQCAPDHPWVTEHPQWFRARPDGTVQYAENPPKRYQDIYPIDFATDDWAALWTAIAEIVELWIARGVRIFRVDNPHTKPFAFWEWLIERVHTSHPDVIFLAEAFTRPKVIRRLAKLGFTQSYTYFAWRNTHDELVDYLTELTQTDMREYFRPNFWPNTPDILTAYLQTGGRPAFIARLVLAATLSSNYGIYGPAFELGEHTPVAPGSEEYLDSEKYEIRAWNLDDPWSLAGLIARLNAIRRAHPALQHTSGLVFHPTDNPQLLCYSKSDPGGGDRILVVVNLDPRYTQSGWTDLRLWDLGLGDEPFQVDDLLGATHAAWHGARNYVQLDPGVLPAHVFAIRRQGRTEQDFPYFT